MTLREPATSASGCIRRLYPNLSLVSGQASCLRPSASAIRLEQRPRPSARLRSGDSIARVSSSTRGAQACSSRGLGLRRDPSDAPLSPTHSNWRLEPVDCTSAYYFTLRRAWETDHLLPLQCLTPPLPRLMAPLSSAGVPLLHGESFESLNGAAHSTTASLCCFTVC